MNFLILVTLWCSYTGFTTDQIDRCRYEAIKCEAVRDGLFGPISNTAECLSKIKLKDF